MRKIPTTMATQHPDNASPPYWSKNGDAFIGMHKEMEESIICFKDLGVSEYMWDWEGKHADASVIDKLFSEYHEYFAKHLLGKDLFLTFRLPNIWEEKGYSLLQAMTVILSSEDFAHDLKFPARPLFEVILPMTQRADQIMHMHVLFEKLARFKSREFTFETNKNSEYLEVIPLVESVESQQNIGKLLNEYVDLHVAHYKRKPAYIRPFMARSDPALVSGLIATVLANKLALSSVYKFSERTNISVYPISGVGSLPFRGGLTPETVDDYIADYPGMRTVTLQSSFRYDHPRSKVKSAIDKLEKELPRTKPKLMDDSKQARLIQISKISSKYYQASLSAVAHDLKNIFAAVPRRRERRQHIGLLAYGRSVGDIKMPRAITFTSGFYSIGVPPEFIGLGRTLKNLSPADLDLLMNEYSSLVCDLQNAGKYLNRDNLAILAKRNPAWKQIQTDIELTEKILGLQLQPQTNNDKAHKNLTSNVLILQNNPAALQLLITETAVLRKSLG